MDDMELEALEENEKAPLPSNKRETFDIKKEAFGWIESITISVVVVALLYVFIGRTVMVDGSSMLTTLHDTDRIVTTPIYDELKPGDVVGISQRGDITLIKRVIAIGGQTVDMDYENGCVLINGEPLEEAYVREKMHQPLGDSIEFPLTVPEGYVFVMGDNRNHSTDSRSPNVGLIDVRNVFGKAIWRIYPFDQVGAIQ